MTALSLLMIIFAYLLGSISSAVLICRLYRLPDPREEGSCNAGATNVLRLGGRVAAIMVMLFDMLKGAIPVYVGYRLGLEPFMLGFVAIAACIEHVIPIFFHFRGGKGVATALGSIAPIGLDLTGTMLVTWLIAVAASGYSSLGAICASLIAPFVTWLIKPQFTLSVAMLSCLIIICHHSNIRRLINGTEQKVKDKPKRLSAPKTKQSQ